MRRSAAVLLLLLVLAACGDSGGAGSPTPSAPARDYHKLGAAEPIGSGYLAGTTIDGSAAYVTDPDPAFPQPGCEGMPESVLLRLPVAGGPRELLGDGKTPVKDLVVRGPGGRIAFVDQCEQFFVALGIARESPDGHISDLRVVKPDAGEEGQFATFSFSWSPDGTSLLAAVNDVQMPDGGPSKLVKIDPTSGEVTPLFTGEMGTGVFQFGQLEDGTYVVASNRVVTFRDAAGKITATFPGNGFTMFPDGKSVAVYGEALSVAGEGGILATLVPRRPDWEISAAAISPDGRAIVFDRYSLQGSDRETLVATLPDGQTSPVPSSEQYGGPAFFTGDGKYLLINRFGEEGGATVLRIPFG